MALMWYTYGIQLAQLWLTPGMHWYCTGIVLADKWGITGNLLAPLWLNEGKVLAFNSDSTGARVVQCRDHSGIQRGLLWLITGGF